MGWDVSNNLVAGKVQMVYGNVRQIRFSDDLLSNDSIPPSEWINIMHRQIHDDQHYMLFSRDDDELIIGNDGGVFKTTLQSQN
jgi:hypothetical protein